MYDEFKKYLFLRKDGRLMVTLRKGKKSTSISYPKYLMEKYLNRKLSENETVDHIDKNSLNNNLSNLRIIDRKKHCEEDAMYNKDVIVKCTYCGKEFTIEGSKITQRTRPDRLNTGYFCSKTCTGKYSADVQNGRIKPKQVENIIPEKCCDKNLSAQREISDVELRKFGEVLDEFKNRLMMIIPSQAKYYLFTDKLEGVETIHEEPKDL